MAEIRVAIKANDAATMAELGNELAALRGQEPQGAQLIDDPAPHPATIEPFLTTVLIAVVAGMAGAVGREIAQSAISWLVTRVHAIAGRRKSVLILSVGKVSLKIDADTDPRRAAATLAKGL